MCGWRGHWHAGNGVHLMRNGRRSRLAQRCPGPRVGVWARTVWANTGQKVQAKGQRTRAQRNHVLILNKNTQKVYAGHGWRPVLSGLDETAGSTAACRAANQRLQDRRRTKGAALVRRQSETRTGAEPVLISGTVPQRACGGIPVNSNVAVMIGDVRSRQGHGAEEVGIDSTG